MIEVPEDPVQVWIDREHRLALHLMDDLPIINGGMKNQPNDIESMGICYEWLPGESILRKRAAAYRSSLRNGQRMMVLYFTDAAKHLRRATRSASNR